MVAFKVYVFNWSPHLSAVLYSIRPEVSSKLANSELPSLYWQYVEHRRTGHSLMQNFWQWYTDTTWNIYNIDMGAVAQWVKPLYFRLESLWCIWPWYICGSLSKTLNPWFPGCCYGWLPFTVIYREQVRGGMKGISPLRSIKISIIIIKKLNDSKYFTM